MGEGREFKLGLSGALPLGAWLKTTTHCPTWKRRRGEVTNGRTTLCAVLGKKPEGYGAFWAGNKDQRMYRREQRPHRVRTLQAGWHHSSGAPWSSFSTLSGCHVQGFACMCSNQASLNSCEEKRDRFRSPV